MIIDIDFLNKRIKGDFMCKPLEKLFGKSAEYLLDTYSDKYSYPIDIVKMINKIGGISLGSKNFSDLDEILSKDGSRAHVIGAVRVLDDGVQIIYADSLDKEKDVEHPNITQEQKQEKLMRRQRFTIAHELAHCCLHIDANQKKNYIELRSENIGIEDENKEKLANIFAGELLMPRPVIDAFVLNPQKYGVAIGNEISVRQMADAFLVNNHTMCERLRYLRDNDGLYAGAIFNTSGIPGMGERLDG